MGAGALAIDRTDDRLAGPFVLSVLFHLAAAGLLLLVSVSCDWCAVVPSGLRPYICPARCRKVKIIRVTPAYTISLVTLPPRGRLTAGGRAKKPVKKAIKPSTLKPGRASAKPAAKPRPRPVRPKPIKPRPIEPTMPPLPSVAIAPPTRPRAMKLPTRKKVQPVKKAPSLTTAIGRLAEAKPSPEALAKREAIRKAKARALEKARADQARKLAAARAKAKRLAKAKAAAQARARALAKKLARLKKRAARRSGPRHLSAAQKIAAMKKRSPTGFGPGRAPGNYGLPSGRPNGGGGSAESVYSNKVKTRVVKTLQRYGRWTRKNVQVTILVKIARSGRLVSARIYKSSGNATYDDRVLGAVQGIRQFVPFPATIKRSWLEFEITIHSSAIAGRA